MSDKTTGDSQHAAQGGDTNPALDPAIQAAIAQALSSALNTELPRVVNSAVSAHVKRAIRDTQQGQPQGQPEDKAEGQPNTQAQIIAAMQAQVAKLTAERDQERARAAEQARDAALRRELEGLGVRDTEVALRALKPELQVEDGNYVRVSNDEGVIPAGQFAKAWLKGREYLLAPSGKAGGGAPGESVGRPANPDAYRNLAGEELLSKAFTDQMRQRN